MAPDVLGLPAGEAFRLLSAAGVAYMTGLTRPTRNVFPVDEARLYVIRAVACPDGSCHLTLAAKQRKGV